MKTTRDSEPMILFGERLRNLRKERGLTQQAVADQLQVDRTTYTKYEIGRVSPDPQGLSKLADLFAVTADTLLGRESNYARLPVMDMPIGSVHLTQQERLLVQMFRQLSSEEQNNLVEKAQLSFHVRKKKGSLK